LFRLNRSSDKFETLLSGNARFDGELVCRGGVRVEGIYKGSIETDGNIIVGKAAVVNATLKGRDVLISGKVTGNIRTEGQLAILAGGQVVGDVDVGSILVEEAGILSGRCTDRSAVMPKSNRDQFIFLAVVNAIISR
jgi:cytoskeletal protein CcmA (bactofilin family)